MRSRRSGNVRQQPISCGFPFGQLTATVYLAPGVGLSEPVVTRPACRSPSSTYWALSAQPLHPALTPSRLSHQHACAVRDVFVYVSGVCVCGVCLSVCRCMCVCVFLSVCVVEEYPSCGSARSNAMVWNILQGPVLWCVPVQRARKGSPGWGGGWLNGTQDYLKYLRREGVGGPSFHMHERDN